MQTVWLLQSSAMTPIPSTFRLAAQRAYTLYLLVSFLKLSEKNSVLKEQSKYCDLCEELELDWIEARWRVTFFGIDMRVEFWQDKLCACLSAHFYCVMIVTKLFCISQEKGYLAWSTNAS